MTDPTVDFLRESLADPATGWAMGTFGAIGEFVRDADEPAVLEFRPGVFSVVTPRAGLALTPRPDLRVVAYETSTSGRWNHGVALCLPADRAAMTGCTRFTELGPDTGALRPEDRDGILFDLGLGTLQVDVLIRVRPEEADQLRPFLGTEAFAPGNPVMAEFLALQPPRIFLTGLGRMEVFAPIPPPDGVSPEGPHTHVLPKLIASGRTHAATTPIPAGLVPCVTLFPPHPLKDAEGRPHAFDPAAHAAFQALLARFGDPDLLAVKEAVTAAALGHGTIAPDSITARFARIAARTALEQVAVTHPDAPGLEAVRVALGESGTSRLPARGGECGS
ncbi:DUF6925 family protein [Segnochrobactraceae bacterium EtOH-i3]